jgi:hypothetical protein
LPHEVEQIPLVFFMQMNSGGGKDNEIPIDLTSPGQYQRAVKWFEQKNSSAEKRKRAMLKLFGREQFRPDGN